MPGVVTVVTSATPFATTQVMPFRRDQALLLPPDARERPPDGDVADVGGAAVEPVPLGSFGVRPIPYGTAQRQPRLPLARESGLLRLGAVAIDGTTGDADASRISPVPTPGAQRVDALANIALRRHHGRDRVAGWRDARPRTPMARRKIRPIDPPSPRPVFNQDPHAVREPQINTLEMAIGREIRARRKQLGLTISELAAAVGLSAGMLSKIETGNISPSLTTLQALAKVLGVPLTALFRGFEERRSATFVKAGEGMNIERRGTRAGHQYTLLGAIENNSSNIIVEPYLITLTTESDVFPTFQHEGLELLFMLEGEVVYRHADNLYRMQPGDSLFFDADAPHGPEELVQLPAR